jgi:hypothetical protein
MKRDGANTFVATGICSQSDSDSSPGSPSCQRCSFLRSRCSSADFAASIACRFFLSTSICRLVAALQNQSVYSTVHDDYYCCCTVIDSEGAGIRFGLLETLDVRLALLFCGCMSSVDALVSPCLSLCFTSAVVDTLPDPTASLHVQPASRPSRNAKR